VTGEINDGDYNFMMAVLWEECVNLEGTRVARTERPANRLPSGCWICTLRPARIVASSSFGSVEVPGILLRMKRAAILLASTICAIAQTPPAAVGNAGAGGKLFERNCAVCHGIDGKGGRGPGLNRPSLAHAPDDEALRRIIADGIPPEMPEGWFLTDDDLANVAAYVRSLGKLPAEAVPGDAGRGRQQYTQSGCSGCHVVQGEGGGYGVSLSDIGSRRNAAYIRNALINPAASLPEGFLLVQVSTESGRKIRGVRLNEDTFTIQLKDASGQILSFRKSSLKELQKLRGESPMPSYQALTPTALQDLIAYLVSLR